MKNSRLVLRMMFVVTGIVCMFLTNACTSSIMFAQKEKALEVWGGTPRISDESDGSKKYRYRKLVATGESMSGTNGVLSGSKQNLEIFCDHYIIVNAKGEIVTHFAIGMKSTSSNGVIVRPTIEEPYDIIDCTEKLP